MIPSEIPLPRIRTEGAGYILKNSLPWYQSSVYGGTPYVYTWPNKDILWEGNTCADQVHKGPPYREGGPLSIWKQTLNIGEPVPFDVRYRTRYHYWGDFRLMPAWVDTPPPVGWREDWGDGTGYGAEAWNKFKPGKPGAALGQFIAEMRDVPRLLQLRHKNFRDIGNNYLNYQFGWRPFLKDLQDFFNVTKKVHARMRYLRNNNGKWIRREGAVRASEESTDYETTNGVYPILVSAFYDTDIVPTWPVMPAAQVTVKKTEDVWFSGLFKFWIPNIEDPLFRLRQIPKMYGLSLSPALLYELIPYSWLADWWGNMGDIMSNISSANAADNLVAKYAYVMTHTRESREITSGFNIYTDPIARTVQNVSISGMQSWERKHRVSANPYGFNIEWPDLSATQMAVLGALGVSRVPKF